jgi:hypothetical protein
LSVGEGRTSIGTQRNREAEKRRKTKKGRIGLLHPFSFISLLLCFSGTLDECAVRGLAGFMLAEHLEVGDKVVEVGLGDPRIVEGRHGAETFADLGADGEGGEGFVVEAGAEAGAAAGVALVAVGHEDLAAVDELGVGEGEGPGEGFFAAGGGAGESDDEC